MRLLTIRYGCRLRIHPTTPVSVLYCDTAVICHLSYVSRNIHDTGFHVLCSRASSRVGNAGQEPPGHRLVRASFNYLDYDTETSKNLPCTPFTYLGSMKMVSTSTPDEIGISIGRTAECVLRCGY